MAKVKISDLDVAAALDGTELVELEQGGTSVKCTTQDIADLGGGGYLKYVALLTQTGTDAPVATVLENTLGGTVVWTRSGAGVYAGTLSGVFTENKTAIFLGAAAGNIIQYGFVDSTNYILLLTTEGGVAVDEKLFLTPIEIRVYP
jgi:hypothetical protein